MSFTSDSTSAREFVSPVKMREAQGPHIYAIHRAYVYGDFVVRIVTDDDITSTRGTKMVCGVFAWEPVHSELFEVAFYEHKS